MFSERVGGGPYLATKGNALREKLMNYLKEEQEKRGYKMVTTPHIGKKELYQTSGHYEKYGEDSFQPINTPKDGEEFLLKPMNCPHHCEVFAHRPKYIRTYRFVLQNLERYIDMSKVGSFMDFQGFVALLKMMPIYPVQQHN